MRNAGVRVTYVEDDERGAVAGREGWDGFENTILGSRSFPAKTIGQSRIHIDRKIGLRGVTGQEMVTSLLRSQLTHRREHAERIASEHDDVLWLTLDGARNASVGNELDGVRATSILGDADIIVIGFTRSDVVDDVLEDGTETDGIVDLGLLLGGKVNALGVASTLDVENAVV